MDLFLTEVQMAKLKEIKKRLGIPAAEFIRRAIDKALAKEKSRAL
jgi:hypothetical protein